MRRSLTFLGLTADPGAKVWGKVDLVGDADGIYPQAPLGIVNGISDGPTAWLLAGIHGDEIEAIAKGLNLNMQLTKIAEAREYRETLSLKEIQSGVAQKTEKEIKEDAKFPETLI